MTFEYPDGATPLDPDEAEGLRLTHITTDWLPFTHFQTETEDMPA